MRAVLLVCVALTTLVLANCTTTAEGQAVAAVDTSWLPLTATLQNDPRLDEAAALLCARDTDAVIDDDVRAAARIWEGRVAGVLVESRAAAIAQSAAVFADQGFTHIGVAESSSSSSEHVSVRSSSPSPSLPFCRPFPVAPAPSTG